MEKLREFVSSIRVASHGHRQNHKVILRKCAECFCIVIYYKIIKCKKAEALHFIINPE